MSYPVPIGLMLAGVDEPVKASLSQRIFPISIDFVSRTMCTIN